MKFNSLRIISIYGYLQSLFFTIYVLFILFSSIKSNNIERIETLAIEVIIYLVISFLIFVTSNGIYKQKKPYFTPFLLVQFFTLIIAWPLMQEKIVVIQVIASIFFLLSLLSIFLLFLPVNRSKFL